MSGRALSEGEGEDAREETDAAGEATELGGFLVPSVMTDTLEALRGTAVSWVFCESCDVKLCLFLFDDELGLVCRFLIESGTPSHFEFTLGTFPGSFLDA
jgi:hypothetical protein